MAINKDDREKLAALLSAPQPTVARTAATTQSNEELLVAHEERRRAQRVEWGQWVATGEIHIGNALAFVAEQPVPDGHVQKFKLEEAGLVRRVASPEQAAQANAHPLDAFIGVDQPPTADDDQAGADRPASGKRAPASKS